MAHRFLQANINHCAAAQDLLLQSMAEWLIEIAVVCEPYFIPPRDNWISDVDGVVTIISSSSVGSPPLSTLARGKGYVAVQWRGIAVIGVYFSPNRTLAEFESFLGVLGALIGQTLPRPVLVVGDLNAKSTAWGSPATDVRGETLEEWAMVSGLLVLNQGSVNTCVRWNGESIVDVTFASPAVARLVREWKVMEGVETLSDHLYIRFDVSTNPLTSQSGFPGDLRLNRSPSSPRWVLRSMDKEALEEASIVQAWQSPSEGSVEIEEETKWFREAMFDICDASMSRAKQSPPKRQVYWWSHEISDLRIRCVAARRQYTRYRRRRRREEEVDAQLYEAYRVRVRALQLSISNAKLQARAELLETLNQDPWGRPYKMVRDKIRPWAPPLTESLAPGLLEDVVSTLFPHREEHTPPDMTTTPTAEQETEIEVPQVSQGELRIAMLKLQAKNKAPGPDGIPGRAWVLALKKLGDRFRRLLDACLESGRFPMSWKTGRLVLLRKDGRPADSPSAYRPLVMLDEADKIFERIIAARLITHLDRVGPDLSDNQFGFRGGRSTIDAIKRVKAYSDETTVQGGVLVAVSLDIKNAFNTIPWACIMEALKYHNVPPYLSRIVGAYLSERFVSYTGQDGQLQHWAMSCGVPQGSVLGPLLWNIGYDWVLRGSLPMSTIVTCYADDTLVTTRGKSYEEAVCLTTRSVTLVINRIRMLGLQVALSKTEAIFFHGPRQAPPQGCRIAIGETSVEIGSCMRYLGLFLDSRWNFGEHFRRMVPRLMSAASALKRLLPNLGGPKAGSRRLYLGVVRSMALYGAPVWAESLSGKNIALLRKPQRVMAIGVVRGYRTISYEAGCVLAGSPPWDLEAEIYSAMYEWKIELGLRGENPLPREVAMWRFHARQVLRDRWKERLEMPRAGARTVEALRLVLEDWLDREHGSLTFRLTQVLTGHGCFGKYLCRIAGREPAERCHHCNAVVDSAQHTLEECPAWDVQRRDLTAEVGFDLSLPELVKAMLDSEGSWNAVVAFCEVVLTQKENAEREREITSDLPIRRKRAGRRRRTFDALHRPP